MKWCSAKHGAIVYNEIVYYNDYLCLCILQLEQLKEFHALHYHPSNAK